MELPTPTSLRLLLVTDARVLITWDVQNQDANRRLTFNVQVTPNIECSANLTQTNINNNKNQATISHLNQNCRYSICVQSIKHYHNHTVESKWSDKLHIITNSSQYDWHNHNNGYFITVGGMTDISTECDSKCTKISFQPPTEPNIWYGYVYHLFLLNGKFNLSPKFCQNDDGHIISVVDFRYPGQCDGVEMFEHGIIDAYTICSQTDRTFTVTELRDYIKKKQTEANLRGQKIIVNGQRPFVQSKLKIFYIDTLKLFTDKKNYLQDITPVIRRMNTNMNKKSRNRINIDWNSHYTYDQFIQYIMNCSRICEAKQDLKLKEHGDRVDIVNIDQLVCVMPKEDGCNISLDRCNYSNMVRYLYANNGSKQPLLFVGFQLLAPRVVNVNRGNRGVTFQILNKQNKMIDNQDNQVLVCSCPSENHSNCDQTEKAVFLDSTQSWRFNVNRRNNEITRRFNVSIDMLGNGTSRDKVNKIIRPFATTDTTNCNIVTQIKEHSFQDHLKLAIQNAKSAYEVDSLVQVFSFCDRFEQLNETETVRFDYSACEEKEQIYIKYTKNEILNETEFKLPLINDEIKQEMFDNVLFSKRPEFVRYYCSIFDQDAPNSKENLTRLVDSYWSYDKLFGTLEQTQCQISKEMLYEIINQRVLSLCDKKDNIDDEDEEEDIDLNIGIEIEVIELKQKIQSLKNKMKLIEKEYDGLLIKSQKLREYAIYGCKSADYLKVDFIWRKYEPGSTSIRNNTTDYGSRTSLCDEYKKALNFLCKKEINFKNGRWFVEGDLDDNLPEINENLYERFLDKNGESNPAPLVMIHNGNNIGNNANKNENEKRDWMPINQVLEIKRIVNHDSIPALNGTDGLFAKTDIPKGTILQQYIGVEFSEQEWNQLFYGTYQSVSHETYLFESRFNDSNLAENFVNGNAKNRRRLNTSNSENSNERDDIEHARAKAKQLENKLFGDDDRVLHIDPMVLKLDESLRDDHFVSRSNDARENITHNRWKKADKARKNCEFRHIRINAWPSVFLETIKDVKKGEELFCDYGDEYKPLIQQALAFTQKKNSNEQYINENICSSSQLRHLSSFTIDP